MTPLENQLAEALKKLVRFAEDNVCPHEDTYRGGTLWEICSACGMKWADDKGGRPKSTRPGDLDVAYMALDAYRQQQDSEIPKAYY